MSWVLWLLGVGCAPPSALEVRAACLSGDKGCVPEALALLGASEWEGDPVWEEAAWTIATADLGPWPPEVLPSAPDGATAAFQERLTPFEGRDTGARAFSFVAETLVSLRPDDDLPYPFEATWGARVVDVGTSASGMSPQALASGLFHEACHRDSPRHVVLDDGQEGDATPDGAYALAAVWSLLAAAHTEDSSDAHGHLWAGELAASRVAPPSAREEESD